MCPETDCHQRLPRVRLGVVVHRVVITHVGGISQAQNHPEERPSLATTPDGEKELYGTFFRAAVEEFTRSGK
jgi:hypothetical protein